MEKVAKFISGILFFIALTAHFLLLAFILSPTNKLISLSYFKSDLIVATDIPASVEDFLIKNDVDFSLSPANKNGFLSRANSKLLQFRRNHFMDRQEGLVFDLNLMSFGVNMVGLEAASQYYYQQPLSLIKQDEWLTLVSLHKIFSE